MDEFGNPTSTSTSTLRSTSNLNNMEVDDADNISISGNVHDLSDNENDRRVRPHLSTLNNGKGIYLKNVDLKKDDLSNI